MDCVSRKGFLCAVLLVGVVSPSAAFAKPKPRRNTGTDREYVSALAAANRFLQAWQEEDHEAGLLLLTDNAKHRTSAEHLESLFSPETPASRGYQIAQGRKLNAHRYVFPVTLLEADRTNPNKAAHTRTSQIVVVDSGRDEWAVDRLP